MKSPYTLALIAAALAAPLAQAHHSFAAEFDRSKPVKLTGVVTKLEWQNPHIWFYIDVKSDGWLGRPIGAFPDRRAGPADAPRR